MKRAREDQEEQATTAAAEGAPCIFDPSDPYFLNWDVDKLRESNAWKDRWEIAGNIVPPPTYGTIARLPRTYEALSTWLNRKVRQVEGKNIFVEKQYHASADGTYTVQRWSKSAFEERYQHVHFCVPETEFNQFTSTPHFIRRWLRDPTRPLCVGLDCFPNPADAVLRPDIVNTWPGYRFEIDGRGEGSEDALIARFLEITQLMTNGNAACTEWLLNWLASIVQKPWVKQGVMPILIDAGDCGKGVWSHVVCAILGERPNGCNQGQPAVHWLDPFTDEYNGFLKDHTFIHIAHVHKRTFGRGPRTQGRGLAMIDDPKVTVRTKNEGTVTMRSCHHFLGNANDAKQLPPEDDPRVLRIHCSTWGRNRPHFWQSVADELCTDNAARTLFWWLKRRYIDGFCARTKPNTKNLI